MALEAAAVARHCAHRDAWSLGRLIDGGKARALVGRDGEGGVAHVQGREEGFVHEKVERLSGENLEQPPEHIGGVAVPP